MNENGTNNMDARGGEDEKVNGFEYDGNINENAINNNMDAWGAQDDNHGYGGGGNGNDLDVDMDNGNNNNNDSAASVLYEFDGAYADISTFRKAINLMKQKKLPTGAATRQHAAERQRSQDNMYVLRLVRMQRVICLAIR